MQAHLPSEEVERNQSVPFSDHNEKYAVLSTFQGKCNAKFRFILIKAVEYNKTYRDILVDFYQFCRKFENANIKKVAETVLACAQLEEITDQIVSLECEIECIKLISRQCKICAEPGFCTRSSRAGLKRILAERVGALKHAYNFSKCNKRLPQFFNKAFLGDP